MQLERRMEALEGTGGGGPPVGEWRRVEESVEGASYRLLGNDTKLFCKR